MSASREKKKRREELKGGTSAKPVRRPEDQRRHEMVKNLIISFVVAIAVILAGLILWTSGVFQKTATAVTIGNQKYTAADYDFYYYSTYRNFVNQYGSYLSYLGLDTSKPLDEQQYSEDETWADYFKESALNQMQETIAMAAEAKKQGYTLSESDQSSIDSFTKSLDEYCSTNKISRADYLKQNYGELMTEKVFFKQMNNTYLANGFSAKEKASLTYTDDQIKSYYQAHTNDIDVVSYQSYFFDGSAKSSSSSGAGTESGGDSETEATPAPTVTPTEAEQAAALAAAKKSADEMLAKAQAGESLADLANQYTPAGSTSTYSAKTDAAKSSVSADFADWLFDSSRKNGDLTVVEAGSGDDESSTASTTTGYYVVEFVSRQRFEYNTVNARHILIQPEVSEGADSATDEQKAAAKAKAEEILQEWKSGAATEDSFAELAEKNSSDTGSSTNGGLYTDIYKGQMEDAFNNWVFDSSRKTGDTGIVETSYGYHVMYFVGQGDPYWKVQTRTAMSTADYTTWHTDLLKNYKIETSSFGMGFTAKQIS